MFKLVTVTVKNSISVNSKKSSKTTEFDELDKLLADGWELRTKEIINSNTSSFFSILCLLEKRS